MPEPGSASANRRAETGGGGAGPFQGAPRCRPSLRTPGTASAGRRPAPPAHSRVPRRRVRRLRGRTAPGRSAHRSARCRYRATLRTAAPRPQQPRSGRLRPGPARPRLTFPGAPPARRTDGPVFIFAAVPAEPTIWAELGPD